MKTIVFFLEEPSAKEMLKGLLPRAISESLNVRYVVFQGKQDLEKNLVKKLRGWQYPESVFVVLRDQDSGDCSAIKKKLVELCTQANRKTALVRIACRELESFYLGDLAAVEIGLEIKGLSKKQNKSKFRFPDQLGNPVQELESVTGGAYQKIAGSRLIGPHLTLEGNKSHSFNVLLSGIQRLIES